MALLHSGQLSTTTTAARSGIAAIEFYSNLKQFV